MHSILDAEVYTSPKWFDAERVEIFRKLWIVAGFRSTVNSHDSFLTHNIGGVPIIVQNTKSGLRAFVNECAHRQAQLHLADFGQRRLSCPYHGWVYDDEGRVRAIPGNEANFGMSPSDLKGLGLTPVSLLVVGGLIFVNLARHPIPITEQFHQAYIDRLEELSSVVGEDVMFGKFGTGYNWKLNFENVVDLFHIPFVHAQSFARAIPSLKPAPPGAMSMVAPAVPDAEISDDIRELSYENRLGYEFRDWPWHECVERCGPTQEYLNLYIYPNVNYTLMGGVVHAIQQFCPIAPDRTEFRLSMALGKRRKRIPAASAILWTYFKAEKAAIDEDTAVLEGLQRCAQSSARTAFHGAYEYRLRRIAKVYRRLVA